MKDKLNFIDELLSELEDTTKGELGDKITLARKYLSSLESKLKEKDVYTDTLADANPHLFYVVAKMEEGVLEQITIGLETYKQAKDYKDRWDGVHPNAFIVASLNEPKEEI
jgi:hypothetical protein